MEYSRKTQDKADRLLFFGFEKLTEPEDIKRRRKSGRLGMVATGAFSVSMAWMAFNAPLYDVEAGDDTPAIVFTAVEAASRTPQILLAVTLGGLSINFGVGAHVLTKRLHEISDDPGQS